MRGKHVLHVEGDVDADIHAFRGGERLDVRQDEEDPDVFHIGKTGIRLVIQEVEVRE